MDMKERTLFSDKVRLVYLQLPYFTKEAEGCETIFEKIIYTLKHMDILQRMPWMAQNAVFKRLSEIAEVASLNSEERRKYDESLRAYRDTLAVMDGQFMQGERKGRAEEKLSNARSLKENGVPADVIAKSLGLTADDIERL
jgi:predicted transposase/invertase (TIGR01784 family)